MVGVPGRGERACRCELPEVRLGPAEYFVVGDNRGMYAADHTFGRVDAVRIVGRVVF